jgi:hypothetical protein
MVRLEDLDQLKFQWPHREWNRRLYILKHSDSTIRAPDLPIYEIQINTERTLRDPRMLVQL